MGTVATRCPSKVRLLITSIKIETIMESTVSSVAVDGPVAVDGSAAVAGSLVVAAGSHVVVAIAGSVVVASDSVAT